MESAIDKHLKCPRALQRRVDDDYTPPFPMFVARANPDLKHVAMAYLGVQYRGQENRPKALSTLRILLDQFKATDGPGHHDFTQYSDPEGYVNLIAVAYWRDLNAHRRWLSSKQVSDWWHSDDRLAEGIGLFREIVAPRAEQFETLYAFTDRFPGVGAIMDRVSGEIEEHGYWGSMRDRIPLSQTSRMSAGKGVLAIKSGQPAQGGRVVVQAHDNICLIRSGQDWAETVDAERGLYLEEIEPTLRAGMEFLRDSGGSVGCYSNRYVQLIDIDGNLLEQSFDIGHWRSIDLLERWAESHPMHLRIFTTFFRVATQLSKLRLYHEVAVFDAGDQLYEYVNCHPRTGMLRDAEKA